MIKDSGQRTEFSTGAVRDLQTNKGRYDLLPTYAIHELARHMEEGCKKYGDRNWEKGVELHTFVNSALRHLNKFMMNMNDEPHLSAAAWNIMCLLDTIIRIKLDVLSDDLNTLPINIQETETYITKETLWT